VTISPSLPANQHAISRLEIPVPGAALRSSDLFPGERADFVEPLSCSGSIRRPGEKDLKNATPLQAQDLQPGDRVLVRGQARADSHSITALSVIVMKQADVSAQRLHERVRLAKAWCRRPRYRCGPGREKRSQFLPLVWPEIMRS